MTKNDLKNIIKGLIIESINESTPKGFPQKIKKKVLKQYPGKAGKAKAYATMQKIAKNLNEEDEMQPIEPQTPTEPNAGEIEAPETAEEHEHAELLAQIDTIIGSLNSLKANLLGHAEGGEVSGDENEMGEEEVDSEEPQA